METLHWAAAGRRFKSGAGPVGGLMCLVLAAACSSSEPKDSLSDVSESVVAGRTAPQFAAEDRAGQLHRLSDFRGKVVLINFWATWCPPCVEEMPSMESLRKKMDASQLTILALSLDDSWEPVDIFIKEGGYGFRVLPDFEGKIAELYGTQKVPETYIVNKQGVIVHKVVGAVDWMDPEMLSFLKKLVSA